MQIVTIKQFALMMVHGFPWLPSTRQLLDAVAVVHRDSALQQAPAVLASGSIVTNMRRLDQYLKSLTPDAQLSYVPFFQSGRKAFAGAIL